ncbi:MAG: ABC transporter ATP-binding protein [Bacilli bacterium]|nr:ABC transporter ATP-binding protein [Acholeplasmataceae bacterium]MDY2902056.1 ABC transporter ATP-binding protein [Bacilli bacterium]
MLEVRNLVKVYNGNRVVDNVSFQINDGKIFGFVGPNGAGKTTTIKAIMGLITFDSGSITFNNLDIKNNPIEFKKEVVYIPDNPDLYDSLTGIQFLNFIADMYDISTSDRNRDIIKYSEMFLLKDSLGNLISTYSHGMKQKLALISAFIRHPKLLILDEPFVGLDPEATLKVREQMKEICNQGGSVFFSTHVLEVAQKICDNVAIISKGKIKAWGTMEDVIGDQSLEEVFFELAANRGSQNE